MPSAPPTELDLPVPAAAGAAPRPEASVHAVARAIALLRALNRQPVSTVDVLFRHTGIPKPTIVRLLRTFQAEGLVRKAPQYGAYLLTSGVVALASGYHGEPRVVEAARPVADALTAEIKWPLAIGLPDGDAMVVRYSTIPSSPLSLLHSTMGMRLSLVSRAIGRAYLAFCEADEQAALIALAAASGHPEDALARDGPAMRELLAQVRRQGYALRDPSLRPVSQTIAVPVLDRGRVAAALGMTWFSSVHGAPAVVERFLPRLQAAAAEVGERLLALEQAAGG